MRKPVDASTGDGAIEVAELDVFVGVEPPTRIRNAYALWVHCGQCTENLFLVFTCETQVWALGATG